MLTELYHTSIVLITVLLLQGCKSDGAKLSACSFENNIQQTTSLEETDSFDGFGTLLLTQNKKLLSIYREGLTHANDPGNIVIKKSYDNGRTWTDKSYLFYKQNSDQRNIIGGTLLSGKIIIFWNEFNFTTSQNEGVYYSFSKNHGENWSKPLKFPHGNVAYGDIIDLPNAIGIVTGQYPENAVEGQVEAYLNLSYDEGLTWSEKRKISSNGYATMPTEEISLFYIGDNQIIGIGRDISLSDKSLLRLYSNDLGFSWDIAQTNIKPDPNDFIIWSMVSPKIYRLPSKNTYELWFAARNYKFIDNRVQEYSGSLNTLQFQIEQLINEYKEFESPKTMFEYRPKLDMGYPSLVKLNYFEYLVQFYSKSTTDHPPNIINLFGQYEMNCTNYN